MKPWLGQGGSTHRDREIGDEVGEESAARADAEQPPEDSAIQGRPALLVEQVGYRDPRPRQNRLHLARHILLVKSGLQQRSTLASRRRRGV